MFRQDVTGTSRMKGGEKEEKSQIFKYQAAQSMNMAAAEEDIDYTDRTAPEEYPRPLQSKKRIWVKIIAVLLVCIVLSLVLGMIVYNWAMQFENTGWETPKVKLSAYYDDGFFIVNVSKAGERTCSISSVEYYLEDENGTIVPGMAGCVEDIYGLNMSRPSYNISLQDEYSTGKPGTKNFYAIRSTDIGGPARGGMVFRLKFDVTGETMGEVRLPDLPLKS